MRLNMNKVNSGKPPTGQGKVSRKEDSVNYLMKFVTESSGVQTMKKSLTVQQSHRGNSTNTQTSKYPG